MLMTTFKAEVSLQGGSCGGSSVFSFFFFLNSSYELNLVEVCTKDLHTLYRNVSITVK